jgi:hypothetical protein
MPKSLKCDGSERETLGKPPSDRRKFFRTVQRDSWRRSIYAESAVLGNAHSRNRLRCIQRAQLFVLVSFIVKGNSDSRFSKGGERRFMSLRRRNLENFHVIEQLFPILQKMEI